MSPAQDLSNNAPLTDAQKAQYIARLKAAWAALPPDQQATLKLKLDQANQQFTDFVTKGTPPSHRFHNTLRLKSYLTNDWEGHGDKLDMQARTEALEVKTDPEGGILGTGKYEQLDPGWELVAGTVWLENLLHKHPFPPGMPNPIQLPLLPSEKLRIVLAGDFGTGNFGASDSPSTKISKIIPTLQPHVTIHLGDVYYAGTDGEEQSKLLRYWPQGSIGSFALNSNHEMYSGGGPYFNDAVGGPVFNKYQSPWSFFAFEYGNWIIVGLDSAYHSGVLDLYMNGSIVDPKASDGGAQMQFLRAIAQKGKKVILLTHHNGFDLTGYDTDNKTAQLPRLFGEVMSAFPAAQPPAYWYWGHKHAGAVFAPLKSNGLRCRCSGHAALPWGASSELAQAKNAGLVAWYETQSAADPNSPLRVFNGFTLLELTTDQIQETFYDELGHIAWSSDRGAVPRGPVLGVKH